MMALRALTKKSTQTQQENEPNKSGKIKGYCKQCQMMLMDGDEECPACACVELVAGQN